MNELKLVEKLLTIKSNLNGAKEKCKWVRHYKENVQAMHEYSENAEQRIDESITELNLIIQNILDY